MVDINAFVQSIKNGPEKFVLTDKGYITHIYQKRFKVSQPFLIDRIITLLNIDTNNYGMDTNSNLTSVGKPILHKDLYGKPCKEAWNYRTEVGMLKYFQDDRRPEMYMAVHQTARFCNNPMLSHEKVIKSLRRYLFHTKKEVIIYNPDISKDLECYVDADFVGGWSQEVVGDADNVMSRTGMVIMYANCPF